MSFFQRMMAALQRFMTGRYGGMDSLNHVSDHALSAIRCFSAVF